MEWVGDWGLGGWSGLGWSGLGWSRLEMTAIVTWVLASDDGPRASNTNLSRDELEPSCWYFTSSTPTSSSDNVLSENSIESQAFLSFLNDKRDIWNFSAPKIATVLSLPCLPTFQPSECHKLSLNCSFSIKSIPLNSVWQVLISHCQPLQYWLALDIQHQIQDRKKTMITLCKYNGLVSRCLCSDTSISGKLQEDILYSTSTIIYSKHITPNHHRPTL